MDSWAAYQFDSAVSFFGVIVENATNKLENKGSDEKPDWKPQYTLEQVLADDFHFPKKPTGKARERESVRRFAAQMGVKTVKVNNG